MNKYLIKDYADGLRKAADVIEKMPEGVTIGYETIYVFVEDKDQLAACGKVLGSFRKSATKDYLNATKALSQGVSVEVTVDRSKVCELVKTGTKIIPAEPEKIIPATPERVEDVYEWKCPDSILNETPSHE